MGIILFESVFLCDTFFVGIFLREIALRITSKTNTEGNQRKNKAKPPPKGSVAVVSLENTAKISRDTRN